MFGTWGESVAVEEILRGAGLDTRAKMKRLGVDEYDLDMLKPVFKTLREHKRPRTATTVSRPVLCPAEKIEGNQS